MIAAETAPRRPGRPRGSKKDRPHLQQITAHLPPDLVSALDRQAEAEGIDSRSEIIRLACADLLRRREKRNRAA